MLGRSLAFVFPGQGSQQVGMLSNAYGNYAAVRETFQAASDALGVDVWEIVKNGPQETLNLTEVTQPVLLTCSVALWRAWLEETGIQPLVMAGHSLGEFSALVCASSLEFVDAVRLVRQRGRFMQQAVPIGQGAMAAIIGLEDNEIMRVCEEVSKRQRGTVAAVNFNSPGQVVIAGDSHVVDVAIGALKEAGAKRAMSLPVSAPFHTHLMKPAADHLASELQGIRISTPSIPVIHNVHVQAESDPEKIRALLVEQIYSPVRWTGCVNTILEMGVKQIVECGPGQVLCGLIRRIDKSIRSYAIEDPDSLRAAANEIA